MESRWIRYTIWLLGALLVLASLDAIPDPPAVSPHIVTVKAPGSAECAERLDGPHGCGSSPHLLAPFQPQKTGFVGEIKPDGPTAFIAQTGQAADPSPPHGPPVFVDRSRS